ncbi:MAG TPA: MFS transporter, partial [Candidatus Thermoplasmatota archaeon]|nr:MFS transporter [Candidatus Thermoplasmatota archaeon]
GRPVAPQAQARPRDRAVLPAWSWAYVAFRLGDGVSSALVPLAVVLHYDLPLWALALTTAAMNLAGVPAVFLWGTLVDRGIDRRALVVGGFSVAAAAMALLAALPPFPLFVVGGILYTVFGVATSPAASTMVLQGVERSRWSLHTGSLSRRTGSAFVLGMTASVVLGLTRQLDLSAAFAATASTGLMAALIAWRTLPVYQPPLPHDTDYDARVVREGARRFERPVYFPGRLRHIPSLSGVAAALRDPARLWPLGYTMTFMGSVAFFTSYPGVLANELLVPAGLVLLAQAPSHILSPLSYPWAGRHGIRVGESLGVVRGSILRTLAIPLMCILVAGVGAPSFPALMVLHGVMGLSFALIQVNGPILLAQVHPGGRGQGVGTYHAAVGTGTLLGALVAYFLLRFYPYPVSYVFSVAMTVLGGACLYLAHRRWVKASKPAVDYGSQ